MKFSQEESLKMFEDLAYGRAMGNLIVEYIKSGKISGAIHPSLGQEAISAGIEVVKRLAPRDIYLHCTHRQQPLIAKNVGLDPFLGELMNKRTGVARGTSGEYHLVSIKDKHLPMQGLLGSGVGTSTGFAWSLKLNGSDAVVLCSAGDGAFSEGLVYESINLAAINKLPIVYLVENNEVAMSTGIHEQAPHEDLYLRANGYNIPGFKVDGNDVELVAASLLGAVEVAAGGTPVIVECKTKRWTGHYVGDMQKYRDTSFLDNKDPIDPLKLYKDKLISRGVKEDELNRIEKDQTALMEAGFLRAWEAEYPSKEDCVNYDNIYSNNAGGSL